MFCSKCGKQISDEASFCEKCGFPTSNAPAMPQPVLFQQPAPQVQMSESERSMKIMASALFIIQSVLTLGFLIAIIASEGGIVLSSGPAAAWVLQGLWDKIGVMCIIFTVAYAFAQVFTGIDDYFLAYHMRNFRRKKIKVIGCCVADVVMISGVLLMCGIAATESLYGELPFLAVFFAIVLMALNVVSAVVYCKAANAENGSQYDSGSSVPSSQVATKPNSAISKLSKIADDSGNAAADGWKCRACGKINNANDPYCKSCGKYK